MRLMRGFAGKGLILAIACPALLFSTTASAEYIQFTFYGEVTEIGGALWDPWLDTQLGDPVTVQYIFDSNAEDQTLNPDTGVYFLSELVLTIGSVSQESTGGAINIFNDFSYYGDDYYLVPFDLGSESFSSFYFWGYNMFDSALLPTDVDWTQYATDHLGVIRLDSDNSRNIQYQFTSWEAKVVPCAPTFIVLLLGISRRRRRV